MFLILIAVALLVGWSLHLMQEASDHREFSLMLAGLLVASAAAALMLVYFLMGNCVSYLSATGKSDPYIQEQVIWRSQQPGGAIEISTWLEELILE